MVYRASGEHSVLVNLELYICSHLLKAVNFICDGAKLLWDLFYVFISSDLRHYLRPK